MNREQQITIGLIHENKLVKEVEKKKKLEKRSRSRSNKRPAIRKMEEPEFKRPASAMQLDQSQSRSKSPKIKVLQDDLGALQLFKNRLKGCKISEDQYTLGMINDQDSISQQSEKPTNIEILQQTNFNDERLK